MNCKNCGYGLKARCGDFEKIICTYEEGECVKITELKAQIEQLVYLHEEDVNTIKLLNKQIKKMKCCVVSHCEGCERLPELYKELENGNNTKDLSCRCRT